MILVTVGTAFFDELIEEVDRLAGKGVFECPVFAQIGGYKKKIEHIDSCVAYDRDLLAHCREADLIITHAGTGSLCECIVLGKPFIAVVDVNKVGNHQLEFVKQLSSCYDFCWIESPSDLEQALSLGRPATPLEDPSLTNLARDITANLRLLQKRTPRPFQRRVRVAVIAALLCLTAAGVGYSYHNSPSDDQDSGRTVPQAHHSSPPSHPGPLAGPAPEYD